ncbi:MAG: 50S ribosomal protein L10 [Candidatus Lokiarchaeota archaeon]|nr:50S ribosomal protein L10 [Candidatus Lokiarchaeota archaeon]
MIGKHDIPQWKLDEVDHLIDLFKTYSNIAVVEVAKLNDRQIQEIRKILRGKAVIRMSKKSLQLRAVEKYKEESNKQNLDELVERIPGQAALCFTDLDIFELKKIFLQSEWMVPAKPNEITPVDIWVPAGDTGLPTGQVISELNMTLRLPTRIQNDTIWVREDTQTHKAGDFVDVKQAAVLKKLGITPIESLIKIHYAWSDGEIISEDILYMDMTTFKQDFIKAYREALGILFEMPFFSEDMTGDYIRKGTSEANILNSIIFGEGIQAPVQVETKVEEKEPEEEEEDEEVGIGGLFG